MLSDVELARIVSAPRFTVLSCCRNAGSYAGWSIKSVLSQTEQSFQLVFVDDNSSDDTWTHVEAAIRGSEHDPRIWRFRRPERHRKLDNVLTYWPIVRGDIVVELDGDDWFSREDALAVIAAAYDADPKVEATAGSHRAHGYTRIMSPTTQPARGFRIMQSGFALSVPAPRSWKRRLTDESLKNYPEIYRDPKTGESWATNADLALYAPALMHAEQIASIEEVLVEISAGGQNHDHTENLEKQREEGMRLFEALYEREWRANEHLLRPFKTAQRADA